MTPPAANLLRAFDAVYLLNLPDRMDRLRDSMAELTKVDAAARDLVEVVPGVRATSAHGFPSVGAYGCFQAHLNALRLARNREVASVLVLEDDLHIEREMAATWPGIAAAVQSTFWDIFNPGFHVSFNAVAGTGNTDEVATANPLVVATAEPLQEAHCYAVRGTALPSLVSYLEAVQSRPAGDPRGGSMHFDGALYHYFVEHPDAVRLRTHRALVTQRSSRSDIAGARWFDRPLLRGAVDGVRRLRNRLR